MDYFHANKIMLFKDYQTIIFFGDSITSAEKPKEIGEGAPVNHPLGSGFVNLLHGYFSVYHPQLHLRLINKGKSGLRTWDLLERIDDEVIKLHPDWVVLMIGVNDAWRQFDCPQMTEFQMTDQDYYQNIEKMIIKTQEQKIDMMICSPFMIESNKKEPLREQIDRYVDICKTLAHRYELPFINMQLAFDELLEFTTSHVIARDRIHPNITGHMLIMREIIKFVEQH